MKKKSKTYRLTSKKRGGTDPIQKQYDINKWNEISTGDRKAATMNVFANVSKDFMTRQGVTAADQETHLQSILGKIYNQGFAKLPGDTTNNYNAAYQKAIGPMDTANITTKNISADEFKQAHENALKNVENEAETKEEKQEIRDSNQQAQQFNELSKEKKISKKAFFQRFPNKVRTQKSTEQTANKQRFLQNKKNKLLNNTSRRLSAKEYAKIHRLRLTRRTN